MQEPLEFDAEFQDEVLSLFVRDPQFLSEYKNAIKPYYFDIQENKILCELIQSHANEFYFPPTKEALSLKLKEKKHHHLLSKLDILFDLKPPGHTEYIKAHALKFAKQQGLKQALLDSSKLLYAGEYAEIEKKIRNALNIDSNQGIGMTLFKDLEHRVENRDLDLGDPVPTGIYKIDKYLRGGVLPGSLNIVMGGTSAGKSILLTNFGAHLIELGLNVVHFTLEMSEIETLTRYDARLSQIPVNDLYQAAEDTNSRLRQNLELVRRSGRGGDLIVKGYSPNTATIWDFKAHLERVYTEMELSPDLVIVDYGDLMSHQSRYNDKRHGLSDTFTNLKRFAADLEIPVWTATQLNRGGQSNKEVPEITDVSEDITKMNIADNVAIIAQTKEEEKSNHMRIIWGKGRNSARNWVVNVTAFKDRMFIGDYNKAQRLK